jgi:hypothetical protein
MINPTDLKARRERLSAELSKLDALLEAMKQYADEFAPELMAEAPSAQRVEARARSRVVATSKPTVTDLTADAVERAIDEANMPISLADAERAVTEAGVPMPETDNPRNVIGARLYNSKRFVSLQGVGWWFKDRPLPGHSNSASIDANENGEAEASPDAEGAATPSLLTQLHRVSEAMG